MKLLTLIALLIGPAAFADGIPTRTPVAPFLNCNLELSESNQFHVECYGPQGLGATIQQSLVAAVKIRCAPNDFKQLSEVRVQAFLGTLFAGASFQCEDQ